MNTDLVHEWMKHLEPGILEPPSCHMNYVESPVWPSKMTCTVGIVHQHRFAFHYWAVYFQKTIKNSYYAEFSAPLLVSVDFHNDAGVVGDFIPEELEKLNLEDENELGLFCWARLRPLNDGHIRPALYLNFFSDVYILLKQDREFTTVDPKHWFRHQIDRFGNQHSIQYFYDKDELIQALQQSDEPIYLDIDLDYFTREEDERSPLGASRLVADYEIRDFLNLNNNFMSMIYPRLVGLTLALEPEHCGGVKNSFHALSLVDEEFFNTSLCTDKCVWRNQNRE